MTKKSIILLLSILVIIVLCLIAAVLVNDKTKNSAAALSLPLSTHTQCTDAQQCMLVNGSGTDQCSSANDCLIKNPQAWCQSHNPGDDLTVTAETYPGGNFSCNCEYNVDGKVAQTPCADSHLN